MTVIASARVDAVRSFNRFYTQRLGLLPEGHLGTTHSLSEARVLYELAHRRPPVASEIAADLRLDPGYMSRIVRRLESHGLVTRRESPDDRRRSILRLTRAGRSAFATLNARARADVSAVLEQMPAERQVRLTRALGNVQQLLTPEPPSEITLREPRPGDLGWVVQRHGELYAAEYGWNADFEALVARIVADFAGDHNPARERGWIAEQGGERLGCVFLVRQSKTVAKLRLLLVDPAARGQGLGGRLVAACTTFAAQAAYKKILLWTQSNLLQARQLYARHGYKLIASEPHTAFGQDLVAETWELALEDAGSARAPARHRKTHRKRS